MKNEFIGVWFAFSLIIAVFVVVGISFSTYEKKCEEKGGVTVYYGGSANCVDSDYYINVNS